MRPWLFLLLSACVPKAQAPPHAGAADVGRDSGVDAGTSEDAGTADTGFDAGEDAGPPDAGGPDAGSPDTGLPSHCPLDADAACSSAQACGDDVPPPTNCEACVPANLSLCADGTCETPPTLDTGDLYSIVVPVNPVLPDLESLGAFAIAARTAGAREITCAELYAGDVDLTDRCYNVLDARSIAVIQTGDTYTVSLTNFASGQRTLFVIYGFTQVGARGDPVGVSCTAYDVGPPRGGQQEFIAGDTMQPL